MSTASSEGGDRRRFYRIPDEVALKYRVLGEEELERALRRLELGYPDRIRLASSFATISAQMHHHLEPLRRALPEVAGYLEGLNEKLDLLIQLMAAAEADLGDQPTHDVDLSASGISFSSEQPIAPGSVLELKLLMFPSYLCILCFGTVVHCDPLPGEDSGFPYRLGVEFTHIRDTDRELIVQHVTRRQSAMLRETRLEREGEPDRDDRTDQSPV